MNEITDTILVNLKIISKIAPNNKLKLLNNTTTIEKEGIASWLLRWYNGDSREKTVNFIKTVIGDSINMTTDIMNSTYINNKNRRTAYEETEFTKLLSTLSLIKVEMGNSKTGIVNLQKTYELDIQIISQLEVIMNKIDGHLGIIERKLREIQSIESISLPPSPIPTEPKESTRETTRESNRESNRETTRDSNRDSNRETNRDSRDKELRDSREERSKKI
jgi:hypothetical protein